MSGIYKFQAVQPRAGVEATFYLCDDPKPFIGFFDHGGAHEPWGVINKSTGKKYSGKDLDSIESWEYLNLK